MATKLSLKMSPQLTINPVIHTFIGFLPLSRLEFIDKIRNEVESNPALEVETPGTPTDREENDVTEIEKRLEQADSSFLTSYKEEGFLKKKR